jgi:hypothetical protein
MCVNGKMLNGLPFAHPTKIKNQVLASERLQKVQFYCTALQAVRRKMFLSQLDLIPQAYFHHGTFQGENQSELLAC